MANPTNTPSTIAPFAPPSPANLESDDAKEARETAAKLAAGKLTGVSGYTVAHDLVGPWLLGQKLNPDEVKALYGGSPDTADHINRLVGLGALVPSFKN